MTTETMEQYESYSFSSISSSHLMFLRLCSFLPLEGKRFSHPLSILLQLWDHFVVIAYNVMWTGYGIRMIQRGDMEIDFICENVVVMGFSIRYIVIYTKRQQFCRLVKFCEKLWSYLEIGEDVVVRQFERKGHYFRNFMLFNLLLMCTLFIATAHFIRLPPLEANGTERKILPFRFFMDVQDEPAYSAVYTLQFFVCYFVDFMIASAETVSLYVIMMACGYLRSVRNRLLSLEGNDDDTGEKGEAAFKLVVGCAHFHQQIFIFCKDIERMTRTLFLFACFCPIYNVSITGIVLLNNDEDKFKFILNLFYNFLQFFLCQWAPEHLSEESEVIAEAAYIASLQPLASSHRQKINRILYFMMMRAQEPVQLTAGGFANLSIETFGVMTKNAFSFFMVLRNFRS